MKPDKSRQMKFDSVFRDLLLDSNEEELREILDETVEDFEALSVLGEEAVNNAFIKFDDETHVNELHQCLGTLINMLRRRERLTIGELAMKAQIDSSELSKIEIESTFDPNPRTIFQLEKFFKLEPRSLIILSGAVRIKDEVRDEALRFAAKSKSFTDLSKEELKLLNQFVKLLQEYTDL